MFSKKYIDTIRDWIDGPKNSLKNLAV